MSPLTAGRLRAPSSRVRRERSPAVLITVVESAGSAPQVPGARMLIGRRATRRARWAAARSSTRCCERARALLGAGAKTRARGSANLTSTGHVLRRA